MDEKTALLVSTDDWMAEIKMNDSNSNTTKSTQMKVDRPVIPQSTIDQAYKCNNQRSYFRGAWGYSCECSWKHLLKIFPILSWLSTYHWESHLLKDAIAGFTVGVMNIPQGMAYAMLGNVPPVVGLYMAFFPVLVYMVFGTSRHVSMGTFAVITLMTGKTVASLSDTQSQSHLNQTETLFVNLTEIHGATNTNNTPLEVAVIVTFMVGIYQLGMCLLRLGIISQLLSDTLVSGLTAGAAVHVFTSQIKDLIGVTCPNHTGLYPVIYTYIGIFSNLSGINVGSIVVSAVTIIILIINNELLKPALSKVSAIPVPIELIAVLAGTLLSRYFDIANNYGLKIVGDIAVGLPVPQLPKFSLIPSVAIDSLVIAVIAYIISVSMALIFAQKKQYDIDPNQELLAQGAGNVVGSFFSCLPFSASLSRSLIQETAGGQTQLASLFSASIIIVVLLWIGPFFEPLPRCVLASLIVVALKGILFKAKDFFTIWKMSRLDGIIWLSTYLTVIFIEIDIGLLVGMCVSLAMLFFQGIKPYTCRLARLPDTEIYVDATRYDKTEEIAGVCVVHYAGCLNFANKNHFKNAIHQIIDEWSKEIHDKEITDNNKNASISISVVQSDCKNYYNSTYFVLNLSALQYVDPTGCLAIVSLGKELALQNKKTLIAGVSGPVYDTLKSCGVLDDLSNFTCFPTIHDAVLSAQNALNQIPTNNN